MKLFDILESKDFEDIDIGDNTYDMLVAFCLDIEDADNDVTQEFLSKMAKQLDVVSDNGDTVVCDVTKWVKDNYNILTDIFDVSGTSEEENIEELVCTAVPGLVSGYVSESVYNELNKNIKEECVTSKLEGFEKMQAVMPLDNFHSMGIKVSDNGETVEYMYSNEDEVYEAEIEYNENGDPYFKTDAGQEYMISDFLRKDLTEGTLMEDVDKEEYSIEFNGIKRKLYSKDELEEWEAIKREISYLEKYVKQIIIKGEDTWGESMELTFGDPNKGSDDTMFEVAFDSNLYGKVKRVSTTFSNTEVNETFVYLANELYNLSK